MVDFDVTLVKVNIPVPWILWEILLGSGHRKEDDMVASIFG